MTVENILATYAMADLATLKLGRQWYRDGGRIASTVGQGDRRLGAAAIAVLSPRKAWSVNVAQALAWGRGDTVQAFSPVMAKLERLRSGENPNKVMMPAKPTQGRKTHAFYHNLAGDLEHVTVDIWALRVALGGPVGDRDYQRVLGRVGAYDLVQDAYRQAGLIAGVRPAIMQATTWIVARGSHD
jgi:hypothetical protein